MHRIQVHLCIFFRCHPFICQKELDAILACRDAIVAVDLAGDEAGFPAGLFTPHFKRVRDAGLHMTIHAGEAAGPESVWAAIRNLGAERIGHGFRSAEDSLLVEQGVKACLNTDDPGISAIDLQQEYQVAGPTTGLSATQIHQSQLNGLDMAFLSAGENRRCWRRSETNPLQHRNYPAG